MFHVSSAPSGQTVVLMLHHQCVTLQAEGAMPSTVYVLYWTEMFNKRILSLPFSWYLHLDVMSALIPQIYTFHF